MNLLIPNLCVVSTVVQWKGQGHRSGRMEAYLEAAWGMAAEGGILRGGYLLVLSV